MEITQRGHRTKKHTHTLVLCQSGCFRVGHLCPDFVATSNPILRLISCTLAQITYSNKSSTGNIFMPTLVLAQYSNEQSQCTNCKSFPICSIIASGNALKAVTCPEYSMFCYYTYVRQVCKCVPHIICQLIHRIGRMRSKYLTAIAQ